MHEDNSVIRLILARQDEWDKLFDEKVRKRCLLILPDVNLDKLNKISISTELNIRLDVINHIQNS